MIQNSSKEKQKKQRLKQSVMTKPGNNIKKAGRLALLALAALLFGILLYYANYDRPIYTSSDTSGIEYEVGRVTGILSDDTVENVNEEGQWAGTMDLQIQILTGRYRGETVNVTNYFSAL